MIFKRFVFLMVLMNFASTALLVLATHKLVFLAVPALNVPLWVKRPWARKLLLWLLYAAELAVLGGLVHFAFTVDDPRSHFGRISALLASGVYATFALAVLSRAGAALFFRKEVKADPDALPEWICPKCSSKMVFSHVCWNCGFKQEEGQGHV